MLYNNGFPASYYNPYYQQMQQPQQQPTQPQQQGRYVEVLPTATEEAVANFPVGLGASQMFLANDDSFIAVKSVGMNGQVTVDVYTKRPPAQPAPQLNPADYVRKDEIAALIAAALKEEHYEPV